MGAALGRWALVLSAATAMGEALTGADPDGDPVGWACLRRTTPTLKLRYPDDAEAHFEEIHTQMAAYSQPPGHRPTKTPHFHGPWIENVWIDYAKQLNASRPPGQPLSAVFGPFIPLLLTWVDTWRSHKRRFPPPFMQALQRLLRPNCPYFTVSQNDEGITGACQVLPHRFPSLLIFSAGGFGHIPVPLFMKTRGLHRASPLAERKFLVSYVGSLGHDPMGLRHTMAGIVQNQSQALNFTACVYQGKHWGSVMANSRFSLVPRGYGRTSYHLAETIQMGRIPIHVYSDVPWVPYMSLYQHFGFATNLAGLPHLLETLANMSLSETEQREAAVAVHRHLWLPEEIVAQIRNFTGGGRAALECSDLPPSIRDAGNCNP